MRKTISATSLATAALFAAFSAASAGACPGGNRAAGAQSPDQARRAMTCLINHRRRHHGLHPVRGNVPLGVAAQQHSEAMDASNFFSHEGDGTPESRAAAAGYMNGTRTWGIGESLAWGTSSAGSPRAIVRDWMGSAEHRDILLSPRWRDIGVGVAPGSPRGADGPGMATYTALFGYRG